MLLMKNFVFNINKYHNSINLINFYKKLLKIQILKLMINLY